MPWYECIECKYKSKIKQHYNRHLNTNKHKRNFEIYKDNMVKSQKEPVKSQKEPVKSQKEPEKNLINEFICDYCEESFSTYANKRRHEIHRCNKNNSMLKIVMEKDKYIQKMEMEHDKEKNEMKKQYERDKKELYKKIDELISKVGNTYNQNIILNNYGSEDLTHITDTFKTQLLKIPYMMIPKMIEAVHFSNEKPENKNIALTNKKDNRVKVYKDNKWIYKNKKDVISNLVDSNYYTLDSHYEESKDNINNFCQGNYVKFREFFNEGDKEMVETLKEECENVLLNNR